MKPNPSEVQQNVGGNFYNKYESKNPIAKWLMQGFLSAFDELSAVGNPKTAFEVGCGEGKLSTRLLSRGVDAHGIDLEEEVIQEANALSVEMGFGERFSARDVYSMDMAALDVDIFVCCEVLEHLPDPIKALQSFRKANAKSFLFSVPREPLWRMMNMARGSYLGQLGNTPGHIQHWGTKAFVKMVEQHFEIVEVRTPLPWTFLLCR